MKKLKDIKTESSRCDIEKYYYKNIIEETNIERKVSTELDGDIEKENETYNPNLDQEPPTRMFSHISDNDSEIVLDDFMKKHLELPVKHQEVFKRKSPLKLSSARKRDPSLDKLPSF